MDNPPQNPNELEDPLQALLSKPLHLQSESELRDFINKLNALRDSSQARQAYFRGKVEKEKKSSAFDEL